MEQTISLEDIMRVLQRTISSLDRRFEHHGEQVAYVLSSLGAGRGFRESEWRRLTALAMIHDIGAYRPDELDRLLKLEVFNPGEHSVYGYLLYREHGPDPELAPMLLYHHWHWRHNDRCVSGISVPREAYLLHMSDRISVLHSQAGSNEKGAMREMLDLQRGEAFAGEDVELAEKLMEEGPLLKHLSDGSYIEELYRQLRQVSLDWPQVISYLTLLATAIDFRCERTATYSFSVQLLSRRLAEPMGITDPQECMLLEVVSLIQGLGRFAMAPASLASRPPLSNADRLHIREQVEKTTRALLAEGVFHALYSEVNQSNPRMSRLRETVIAAEALVSQVEMHHHKNRDECLGYFQTLVDGRRISMDAYNAVSVGYDELLLALSQAQERINERYRLLDAEYHRLIQAYKAAAV